MPHGRANDKIENLSPPLVPTTMLMGNLIINGHFCKSFDAS